MQELFHLFDANSDGVVDLFEFVEASTATARASGGQPDGQGAMQLFMEMNPAGAGGVGGGIMFEEFAEWQVRACAASGMSENDMTNACHAYAAEISTARAALDNAGAAPEGAPTSTTEAATATASAASETLAMAAGRAAAAVRQQRHARLGGGGTGGGGHSTLRQGFVETKEEVALDMDEFDKGFEEGSSSDDGEDEIVTELMFEGADAELQRLGFEMRSNLKECLSRPASQDEKQRLSFLPTSPRQMRRFSKMPTQAFKEPRPRQEGVDRQEMRARNDKLKADKSEFWRRRQRVRTGKLTVHGTVRSKAHKIKHADVDLMVSGKQVATTRSNKRGMFEHSVSATLGRMLSLIARHPGFAPTSRPLGGEGLRQVHVELLPLSVTGRFEAEPGSSERVSFEDSASSTIFSVPIGALVKDGVAFEGEADFEAAVVNTTSRESITAMPPLVGRTVSGAKVPLQTLGAVFTGLKDALDGKDLTLRSGSCIDVAMPSSAPLSREAPSIWYFSEARGEWEQTMQPLRVNGSEMLALDPDAEASLARSKDSAQQEEVQLGKELDAAAASLQDGRQALDAQRREERETKICTCGFGGKTKIMPLVNQVHRLPMSDPPKRIFAATASDGHGGVCLTFPYLTVTQIEASAKLASSYREVILSHHLAAAKEIFEERDRCEGEKPWSRMKWRQAIKKAAPHLQQIVAWLLDGAHAVNIESGETVYDIDPAVFQLRVLERMVNLWAQPQIGNSRAITLHELREALLMRSGDIIAAFLDIGQAQIRRDEVARVRELLKNYDPMATARYRDVEKALQAAEGDVDAAAKALSENPAVRLQASKLHVRERLQKSMPMAHPSSRLVEQAIAQATAERQALEAEAEAARLESARAAEKLAAAVAARDAAEKAENEASARGDFRAAEAAARDLRMTTRAAAQAEDAATNAAATAAKAAAEAAEAGVPENAFSTAANTLKDNMEEQNVQQVYKSWRQILQAASDQNMFNFEIADLGWTNVDAPEVNPPRQEAPLRPLPPDATQEFFPPPPEVVCPIRVSSMVLGAFDANVCAASAMACSLEHCGIDYADEVQPDGTFSLVTLAETGFELRTTKLDGTSSLSFGPFEAKGPYQVTHVGLLEPTRPEDEGRFVESELRDLCLVPSTVEIVLPRLEFPPHGPIVNEDAESRPIREERCTCFEGYDEEEDYDEF